MEPFDLEAAKRGDPIQTRDGRPVKFIAHVPEAKKSRRVIVLTGSLPGFRHEDGTVWAQDDRDSDLFMAPRKRTLWVNVYEGECCIGSSAYETQERADSGFKARGKQRIGGRAWPLEIEE